MADLCNHCGQHLPNSSPIGYCNHCGEPHGRQQKLPRGSGKALAERISRGQRARRRAEGR